jgi:hypothetical protein
MCDTYSAALEVVPYNRVSRIEEGQQTVCTIIVFTLLYTLACHHTALSNAPSTPRLLM